ncbi:MAG: uracil-DNA glycosylase family protein [Saprospiraceae bacterium]
MQTLLKTIRACRECEACLPYGANPVLDASPKSKILVIGQAPGRIVHNTNIPWNDKSGKNLRNWLGVDDEAFYDTNLFGIVPMGFCYPGTGKSGDLPPRKECAPLWHQKLIDEMPQLTLYLLIGAYAQKYYLGKERKKNLTETVRNFKEYLPNYLPLPHPSPRNNIWQAKNPWFAEEVLPVLKERVSDIVLSS